MLSRPQKRVVLGAAAFLALVIFAVPLITIRGYKASVTRTLSQAIGRDVTIDDISIQTFPQPGLLMSGVVIGDDPTISAEPMLRADEVLATLRISSLWRGRLEIGTLKLKYPSLNLVRANDGRWNLTSLFERARETPAAPTSKVRPESRPRFPYIESDGGRINLKIGNEKKVFALSDADFAVWLASEDEWRMRLEARPIRTDANLSDTGTLKMEGSWRRAPELHQTPISVNLWWDYGQLGQVTHLIYGRDRGWRGEVHAAAHISGRPEHLAMHFDAEVNDFRRYDILSGESVSLEAHCNSEYNFTAKRVENVACTIPAGSGVVLANGTYEFLPQPRIDLSLTAENVPVQYLALVARHAKRDLPSDMSVTGMLSAVLTVRGESGNHMWAGNGELSDVEVRSSVLSRPLLISPSRWSLVGPGAGVAFAKNVKLPRATTHLKRSVKMPAKELMPAPVGLAWKLDPVAVKLGGDAPATLAGWFSHDGYFTELRGAADLDRLFELAKLAGLPKPASDVTGNAKGAVQVSGEWAGFVPATLTGDAELKNITAKFGGVAAPLRIASAHFVATKDAFTVEKAAGSFAGLHSALDFTGHWPQHCIVQQAQDCALRFQVAADQLDVDEVNSLVNPRAQKRPWYADLIGSQRAKFPEIYAQGQISAAKLIVKNVPATRVSARLELSPHGLTLTSMNAMLFGGAFNGELTADFSQSAPAYQFRGALQKTSLSSLAAPQQDAPISGTGNFKIDGHASGWNAEEIAASAAGALDFNCSDGALTRVSLDADAKPLRFKSFSGTLKLQNGAFSFSQSKVTTPTGIYTVSGTAAMNKELEIKLVREGGPGYSVTGSLELSVVTPIRHATSQATLVRSGNR